jgi:NADH-quinone oxidoreductase subunit C
MVNSVEELVTCLKQHFPGKLRECGVAYGEATVEISPADVIEVCKSLSDDPELSFEQLMDLCGVDYSAYGDADWQTEAASNTGFSRGVGAKVHVVETDSVRPRFAVVYHLLSVKNNQRLRVRVRLPEDALRVSSVVDVWASADWYEREAFDLFGILFEGHPDLRRLLTDYGFIGHPFRKDFPLEGNVEVRYDPEKGRVVYQPVTIENRVLVPRVIRQESGAAHDTAKREGSHA